ncbi:MAG: hypothetical protein ABJF50_22155 [Paracoccaceae bacterium]
MSIGLPSEFFHQLLTYALVDDTHLLTKLMSVPLIVYTPKKVVTFDTDEAFQSLARKYRIILARKGAIRVETNIVEYTAASRNMESYLVEQHHLDKYGKSLGSELLRYYVRNTEGQPVVEMIEQLQDPFVFADCGEAC